MPKTKTINIFSVYFYMDVAHPYTHSDNMLVVWQRDSKFSVLEQTAILYMTWATSFYDIPNFRLVAAFLLSHFFLWSIFFLFSVWTPNRFNYRHFVLFLSICFIFSGFFFFWRPSSFYNYYLNKFCFFAQLFL